MGSGGLFSFDKRPGHRQQPVTEPDRQPERPDCGCHNIDHSGRGLEWAMNDAGQIVQLLSTFGFPTVAAVVMWKVLERRTEKSEEHCRKVQDAQANEIIHLRTKLDDMEGYVRVQLTELIRNQAEAHTESATVLRDVRDHLRAHQ